MVEAMPIVGAMIAEQIAEHFDNSIDNLGQPTSSFWYGPRWAQAATAPSRLHKAFTAQGGIRVPFFASGPGVANGGSVSRAFSTAMDIPLTILDIAGIAHPSHWQGRSVAPTRGQSMRAHLAGKDEAVHRPGSETGWELFGRRAIRRDHYKAIWLRSPEGTAAWQLYDLDADPGEVDDLAGRHPEILAELVAAWDRYVAEAGIIQSPTSLFEMEDGF